MRAARIAGLLAGAAFAVSAFCLGASADTLTLTPEQTIALYGSTFAATFYDSSGDEHSMTANYYSTSRAISGEPASSPIYSSYVYGGSTSTNNMYKTLWTRDYIIYKFTFDASYVPSYNRNTYISFTLNPMLRGITSISQCALFGIANNTKPTNNQNSSLWNNIERSTMLFNTSAGTKTVQSAYGSTGIMRMYTSLIEPNFGNLDPDYVYGVTGLGQFAYDSESQFDLGSLVFTWNAPCSWGREYYTNAYFLYIECPTLGNYTPPVTTTATTAATTRPQFSLLPPVTTKPAQTVDLSSLESGVAAIVEQGMEANNNLDWIGNNVMVGVNNLAYIANRLDDIYNAMQQAGQIPIDSTGELMNGVQSGLTSYTTARIPTDAAAGLTFWAWFMGKIMEQAWIAELAALGSCLAVTYFILFRGRNS